MLEFVNIITSEYTYIYQHFIHFTNGLKRNPSYILILIHDSSQYVRSKNALIRKISLAKQKVFKNRVAKETTYNTDYFFTALSQAISLNSIIFYHYIRYPTISLCFIHQVLHGKSRSRSIVT